MRPHGYGGHAWTPARQSLWLQTGILTLPTTDLDPELEPREARDLRHTPCTQTRPHFSPGPRSRTQHRWSYLRLGVHFHKHSSSVRVVTLALANAPASRVTRSFDRAVAQLPLQHRLHGSCGTANLLQACSRSGRAAGRGRHGTVRGLGDEEEGAGTPLEGRDLIG